MANELKMAEQHAITRLAEHGWSYRGILAIAADLWSTEPRLLVRALTRHGHR